MTLRTRLTLLVVGIVAVAVIGGTVAAYVTTSRELRDEIDAFLVDRVGRIANAPAGDLDDVLAAPATRPRPDGDDEHDGDEHEDHDEDRLVDYDAVTQVIGSDGTVLAAVGGAPLLPVTPTDEEVAAGEEPVLRDVEVDGEPYRMITAQVAPGQAVQVARSLEETDAVLGSMRTQLLLIAGLGALVAGALAWWLARRTAQPIERLTAAAEAVAATEDLSVPIPVEGDDEVARLGRAFDTMLSALATSRDQQKRLVMDASHELRTPLTAIRTNIDLLARADSMAPDARRDLLSETQLELVELTDLVAELVDLATDARSEEPIGDVDLGEVAAAVAGRAGRRSGREVVLRTLDGAHEVVRGRPAMVERAVSNLVENALKFSDPPSAVEIEVGRGRIDVLDRGIGISEPDRDRAFDRFYRADAARTRPGSGLGLAIVAQVAAVHGGSAQLAPRDGGGTVATLRLPTE